MMVLHSPWEHPGIKAEIVCLAKDRQPNMCERESASTSQPASQQGRNSSPADIDIM